MIIDDKAVKGLGLRAADLWLNLELSSFARMATTSRLRVSLNKGLRLMN